MEDNEGLDNPTGVLRAPSALGSCEADAKLFRRLVALQAGALGQAYEAARRALIRKIVKGEREGHSNGGP